MGAHYWGFIGSFLAWSRRPSLAGVVLLWEKKKKKVEVYSYLHFLDNLEGEELDSFQGGYFSCTEIETLFCA